jgi:hypothetical protein
MANSAKPCAIASNLEQCSMLSALSRAWQRMPASRCDKLACAGVAQLTPEARMPNRVAPHDAGSNTEHGR